MKFCVPLGECVTPPWRGEKPPEVLDADLGGEFQTGDVELCRERGGEADPMVVVLGGELKRTHLELTELPGRRPVVTDWLFSVGEELHRLLDESLRGRLVSSRSLRVRMW